MEDSVAEELKLVQDINHALTVYKVDELDSEDELTEGLEQINDLSEKFRAVHVTLQVTFKDDYATKFTNKDKTLEKMSTFIKTAKKKQRSVRKDKKCKISISKFDTLETKVTLLRESYNIDLVKSISELDDFLTKGQSLIDEYISIFSELKNSVSDEDFEKDYRPKYEKMSKDLSEDMKIVRVLKSKLKDHDVKPTIPNVVPDKQSEPTDIKSVSVYTERKAENLSQEIILRSDSLSKRYGQTLNILGDYQILEITQNQNLELEFNRILEKMTGAFINSF